MTFSVGSGSGTATARILAIDDSVAEGDHNFTVSIAPSPNVTVGTPSSVAATIMDDDRKSEVW